ncbi:MAG TPA: TIGR03067 domain-containing protein [Urbifossiella sp.]|nr:TIGR03067 domain-containing protein [Urbifossiella sp.]
MRYAPLFAAFTIAAGLVGFSAVTGQPPADKAKKADPDLAAIQGEWTITKLDVPGDRRAPPADYLKQTGVTIKGDLVTLRPPAEGARAVPPIVLRFVLDSTKAPRQADVTPLDEKGEVRRRLLYSTTKGGKTTDEGPYPPWRAVYKLESDTLVVSAPLSGEDARPTAFKAIPPLNPNAFRNKDQGYGVVELSRKK